MRFALELGHIVQLKHALRDKIAHLFNRVWAVGGVIPSDVNGHFSSEFRGGYFGGMRSAPSRRMTSPLSISFSRICLASAANSAGLTQASRERNLRAQHFFHVFGQPGQQRRIEQTGRRWSPRGCPASSQVAGNRQSHADDAAFRRRISRLPDLAVIGRDGSSVDDQLRVRRLALRFLSWPFARRRGAKWTLNVPIRLTSITRLNEARECGTFSLPTVFSANADARAVNRAVQFAERWDTAAATARSSRCLRLRRCRRQSACLRQVQPPELRLCLC